MRIAQVSTLASPVCQNASGSVESLIWHMTRELAGLGHKVTVFGTAGSEADGEIVSTLPGPYGENDSPDDWHLAEWINLCAAVQQSGRFDVLHTHAYLWGVPLEPLSQAPMVHTLHIVPEDDSARLRTRFPGACITGISREQWSAYPRLPPAAIIPHGVDTTQFTLRTTPDDYVGYLGRFEPGKGPCQAIAAARQAGLRLLMAGPENPYFREVVKPLIDGKTVEYVGLVQGAARDRFLGGARALVYPIQYPEAFGLVQVEAMLCGTPVAALRRGAVAEIINEGLSGFSVSSLAQMPGAITQCLALDRRRVRQQAEQRFSLARMAQDYVRVYQAVIAQQHLA